MWSNPEFIYCWWVYPLVKALWKTVFAVSTRRKQSCSMAQNFHFSAEMDVYQRSVIKMFASSIICVAPNWKLSRCPSMVEWIHYATFTQWNTTEQKHDTTTGNNTDV
jgi:hypothetical protein